MSCVGACSVLVCLGQAVMVNELRKVLCSLRWFLWGPFLPFQRSGANFQRALKRDRAIGASLTSLFDHFSVYGVRNKQHPSQKLHTTCAAANLILFTMWLTKTFSFVMLQPLSLEPPDSLYPCSDVSTPWLEPTGVNKIAWTCFRKAHSLLKTRGQRARQNSSVAFFHL